MSEQTIGERFARALAAKDREGVLATLSPDVDFRGLTPGKFWETSTATAAVDVFFDQWFGTSDVKNLLSVEAQRVSDRNRVGYLMELTDATGGGNGPWVVEQQAYYDIEDDKISWLRILCSGFRPMT